MISAPSHSTVSTPADRQRRDPDRVRCALGAAWWVFVFAWLWAGAPALGRVLGAAWFALGALWPGGFLYSLALAFPWLGNNPGGPHHLYLVEMGLMGLVAGHLAARALRGARGNAVSKAHWAFSLGMRNAECGIRNTGPGVIEGRRDRLDLWVFLFAAWSCLTIVKGWFWIRAELLFDPRRFMFVIFNHSADANVFSLQAALKLLLGVGLYIHLRDRPWAPERLRRLLVVLLAGVAFTALVGWLNYVGLLSLAWWRGANPFIDLRFGSRRLQSLYWHSGWLAQYIEALGPAALALGLTARRRFGRAGFLLLAALLAVTQFFTMARAGWIGLAGGYAVVIAAATLADVSPRRLGRLAWRLALLAGLLVLMAGLLALLHHDFRSKLGELFAWRHRSAIWQSAAVLYTINPLTGCGLGNYYFAVSVLFPVGHPYWAADNITAHNLYLHILVERGAMGLALFLVLGGALVRRVVSGAMRNAECGMRNEEKMQNAPGTVHELRLGQPPTRPVAWAILGGLTALALDGLFQYSFYIRVIEILFWMMAGWAVGLGGGTASAGEINEGMGGVDEQVRQHGCRTPKIASSLNAEHQPFYGSRAWRRGWGVLGIGMIVILASPNDLFRPPQALSGGMQFHIATGPTAVVPLPEGARRIRISLLSLVPTDSQPQPIQTLTVGGQTLGRVEFLRYGEVRTLELDLPGRRAPGTPLVIQSSCTWSLWALGARELPYHRMGVVYTTPEAIED